MPIYPESGGVGSPSARVLRIGRVVFEDASFELERTAEGITLDGLAHTDLDFDAASELARTWRDDLRGHEKEQDVVGVTWGGDYDIDGYYRVASAEVQTKTGYGNYRFTVGLTYAVQGTSSPNDIVFESRLSGSPTQAVTNDFGITTAAEPAFAPPLNHGGFDSGATVPASFTRTLASGYPITVYRDVTLDAKGAARINWSLEDPGDLYVGAVSIRRNS